MRGVPSTSGARKSAPATEVLPESVDELLTCGYLGTAIEILERKIKEQPEILICG